MKLTREQVEALLAGATPGPWTLETASEWPWSMIVGPNVVSFQRIAYGSGQKTVEDVRSAAGFPYRERESIAAMIAAQEANAALTAAAPDLARALIAAWDALAEAIEELESGWGTEQLSMDEVLEHDGVMARLRAALGDTP